MPFHCAATSPPTNNGRTAATKANKSVKNQLSSVKNAKTRLLYFAKDVHMKFKEIEKSKKVIPNGQLNSTRFGPQSGSVRTFLSSCQTSKKCRKPLCNTSIYTFSAWMNGNWKEWKFDCKPLRLGLLRWCSAFRSSGSKRIQTRNSWNPRVSDSKASKCKRDFG